MLICCKSVTFFVFNVLVLMNRRDVLSDADELLLYFCAHIFLLTYLLTCKDGFFTHVKYSNTANQHLFD